MPQQDWTTYTVEVSPSLLTPNWTELAVLDYELTNLNRYTGAKVDTATIVFRFGSITRYDPIDEKVNSYVPPVTDFVEKYVRIVVSSPNDPPYRWYGYVLSEKLDRWAQEDDGAGGQQLSGGTQTFSIVGLEHFLSQKQIIGSSSDLDDRDKRAYGYNAGPGGAGRAVAPSNRANRSSVANDFIFNDTAIEWTATNIVTHLLTTHTPQDDQDLKSPCVYDLDAGATNFLDWFKPTIEVDGKGMLDVLGQIVSMRRGLTFWFVAKDDGQDGPVDVTMYVSSILTAPLNMPQGTTIAAAAIVQANFQPDDYPLLTSINISQPSYGQYDIVRVRGARRTSTFTLVGSEAARFPFSINVNSYFVSSWGYTNETEYHDGLLSIDPDYASYTEAEKADKNDRYRQSAKFNRVFKNFSLFISAIPDPTNDIPLSPKYQQISQDNETIVGNIDLSEIDSVRVLRTTMLRSGYDYADASAPTKGDLDDPDEYLDPLVFCFLRATVYSIGANNTIVTLSNQSTTDRLWRYADKLSLTAETIESITKGQQVKQQIKTNVGFVALSGEAGFQLPVQGLMQHAIDSPFLLPSPEPSRYPPEVHWAGMAVTVSVEWDAYCEATWPDQPPPTSPAPLRELVVSLDDRARFDWLAKGTIYDIDETGNPKQVQTHGALRDDRWLCRGVAQLAYEWYATDRQEVRMAFKQIAFMFDDDARSGGLGTLLADIGTDEAAITVNSVITSIAWDFRNNSMQVETNTAVLDFAGLV